MISNRTISCVLDVLLDIPVAQTLSLLTQGGVSTLSLDYFYGPTSHFRVSLRSTLLAIDDGTRMELCSAIVGLQKTIRYQTTQDTFDERWRRFDRSLALDGYLVEGEVIIATGDPVMEHLVTAEEPLSMLILQSGLSEAAAVVTLIDKSAEDYLKLPPDLNGCLSNIRTALETLAKSLSLKVQLQNRETKDTSKWGTAISYLCSKGILSKKEETLLTAIYSLLSEHHRPVRIDENEMVQFARSIALGSCWLLSKKATYDNEALKESKGLHNK